jgi:O-antigen ligase
VELNLLPFGLLFVCIPLTLALALWAPLYVFLLLDLLTVLYPGEWQIAGVHLDVSDLLLAGILIGLLRPRVAAESRRRKVPYLGLWLILGVLQSLAYYVAPVNQPNFLRLEYLANHDLLAGLLGLAYQIYRYCWRPILYYPLAILLLADHRKLQAGFLTDAFNRLGGWLRGDRRKLEAVLLMVVLAGAVCAAIALPQGYAGDEATGPFAQKNGLGGALIMPFFLALTGMYTARLRWQRRFYVVSLLIMVRSLLFAGSRGAFVAVLGGLAFLALWLLTTKEGRSKAGRFALAGALVGVVTLGLKPDLFYRPNVQQFFSISSGTEADTMQWRIHERWPHFWQMAMDNFWLGTGTDVDPSLGDSCITPHNGYLGIAVVSGIPSMALVVLLALLGLWNGMRAFRRNHSRWQSMTGLAVAAALVALLIHNIVDQTIRIPFCEQVFWMLAAAAATIAARPLDLTPVPVPATAPRRARGPVGLQVSTIGGEL